MLPGLFSIHRTGALDEESRESCRHSIRKLARAYSPSSTGGRCVPPGSRGISARQLCFSLRQDAAADSCSLEGICSCRDKVWTPHLDGSAAHTAWLVGAKFSSRHRRTAPFAIAHAVPDSLSSCVYLPAPQSLEARSGNCSQGGPELRAETRAPRGSRRYQPVYGDGQHQAWALSPLDDEFLALGAGLDREAHLHPRPSGAYFDDPFCPLGIPEREEPDGFCQQLRWQSGKLHG